MRITHMKSLPRLVRCASWPGSGIVPHLAFVTPNKTLQTAASWQFTAPAFMVRLSGPACYDLSGYAVSSTRIRSCKVATWMAYLSCRRANYRRKYARCLLVSTRTTLEKSLAMSQHFPAVTFPMSSLKISPINQIGPSNEAPASQTERPESTQIGHS